MEIKTLWKKDKTNDDVYEFSKSYLHVFEYNNRKFKIKLRLKDEGSEGMIFEGGVYIMKDGIFEDAKIMEDVFIICYEKGDKATEETEILFSVTTEMDTENVMKFENKIVEYIKAVY